MLSAKERRPSRGLFGTLVSPLVRKQVREMADSDEWTTREKAAQNEHIDLDTLVKLLHDDKSRVMHRALRNPVLPLTCVEPEFIAQHSEDLQQLTYSIMLRTCFDADEHLQFIKIVCGSERTQLRLDYFDAGTLIYQLCFWNDDIPTERLAENLLYFFENTLSHVVAGLIEREGYYRTNTEAKSFVSQLYKMLPQVDADLILDAIVGKVVDHIANPGENKMTVGSETVRRFLYYVPGSYNGQYAPMLDLLC